MGNNEMGSVVVFHLTVIFFINRLNSCEFPTVWEYARIDAIQKGYLEWNGNLGSTYFQHRNRYSIISMSLMRTKVIDYVNNLFL